MKLPQLFLCFALLACLQPPIRAAASIEGVVSVPSAGAAPATQGRYKLKASAPVGKAEPAEAVVYLEGSFPEAPPKKRVQMGQQQYQFRPGVLVVETGTTVEFPNLDDDYHNVFSYSKPKRFDLGRYRKSEAPPAQTFEKPGLVKLYCEIHEHMRASILVVDTPHFVVTRGGKFRLENLPTGKFKLKAWLNEETLLEQEVELKEGETLAVNFP